MSTSSIAKFFIGAALVPVLSFSGPPLAGQDTGATITPRGGEQRKFSNTYPSLLWMSPYHPGTAMSQAYPAWPHYYPGYFGTPWYVTQTRKFKYPVPQYEFPKLGLHHLYPYGYQFGIQIPPETDEPLAGPAEETMPSATPRMADATSLLRAGKYAEAGRALAMDLHDEAAPPELYLLISEALLGAGKDEDADIVLRQAIDTAPNLDFLDRADVVGDFPSRDVLKDKISNVTTLPSLIRGTFLILAGEKEQGMEDLRNLVKGDKDPAAKKVYLHFLGAAFGEPEKAAAPEKKAEAPPPPPARKA